MKMKKVVTILCLAMFLVGCRVSTQLGYRGNSLSLYYKEPLRMPHAGTRKPQEVETHKSEPEPVHKPELGFKPYGRPERGMTEEEFERIRQDEAARKAEQEAAQRETERIRQEEAKREAEQEAARQEAERIKRESAQREAAREEAARAKRLSAKRQRYGVNAEVSGFQLVTNPFRYEGKVIILSQISFVRMFDRDIGDFETFHKPINPLEEVLSYYEKKQILVSNLPSNLFDMKGQLASLIVRVKGLAKGKNAFGGPVSVPLVEFIDIYE